jgi:hypothetical protein
MAKLSNFRQDSAAIEAGEWVTLPEWDNLRIKTRGFTNTYKDAMALRRRRAAQSLGGDESKIPAGIMRAITVEALIVHLLLDVADLTDERGQPVDFEAFCALLRNPDYEPLGLACIEAAQRVGKRQGFDMEDMAGPLVSA